MAALTRDEAIAKLATIGQVRNSQNRAVLEAYRAGVSKTEIQNLTGLARSTIDRII
jgi:predicted transcriptional regulator